MRVSLLLVVATHIAEACVGLVLPLCRFHRILGSEQKDKIKALNKAQKGFSFFIYRYINTDKPLSIVFCFIFNRTKCRSVYLGCIHLQQLVRETGCSHKAGSRSFFGCPQPEVTQQWPVTPRCHLSSPLPQTTDSRTAQSRCNKNVCRPMLKVQVCFFAHLHLVICGSDDISKIGGLLPLLQVNRGA